MQVVTAWGDARLSQSRDLCRPLPQKNAHVIGPMSEAAVELAVISPQSFLVFPAAVPWPGCGAAPGAILFYFRTFDHVAADWLVSGVLLVREGTHLCPKTPSKYPVTIMDRSFGAILGVFFFRWARWLGESGKWEVAVLAPVESESERERGGAMCRAVLYRMDSPFVQSALSSSFLHLH